MKLHAPGMFANPERLVWLEGRIGQQYSARRELNCGLLVGQVGGEFCRQLTEQGV